MHLQAYRIISTTRFSWGIRPPEASFALDGVDTWSEGARELSSEGAGRGQFWHVDGDLRGRESGAQAFEKPRFGRWAGQGLGVRGPIGNETPLSLSEVEHGFEHGILDSLPMRRTHKPIGAWERPNINMMAKAMPFDGLLA